MTDRALPSIVTDQNGMTPRVPSRDRIPARATIEGPGSARITGSNGVIHTLVHPAEVPPAIRRRGTPAIPGLPGGWGHDHPEEQSLPKMEIPCSSNQ